MNSERNARRLNEHLGSELGRNFRGEPVYAWMFSEDSRLKHPMRVQGEYDYKANEAGIIEALPVYELRSLCLTARAQWVLCHWIESPPEHEWRAMFGYNLEWPKGGQYYPTNVTLDPGEEPSEILNQTVIEFIREQFKVSPREVEREATEAADKAEQQQKDKLYEEIREACTTFDHVPGTKDAVSYPAPPPQSPLASIRGRKPRPNKGVSASANAYAK